MRRLDGKVALVTGAASRRGIGRAAAVRFAQEGADLVVVGRHAVPEPVLEVDKRDEWRGLESVVAEIQALGCRAMAIEADVSMSEEVSAMTARATDQFGRIDILANVAGIGMRPIDTVDLTEKSWNEILAINLTGTFLVCKEVAREMIKHGKGGKIINVSSRAGKVGVRGCSAYSASKFGMIGLTQTLALELAPHKININAVCPGATATDLWTGWAGQHASEFGMTPEEYMKDYYAKFVVHVPLGRVATGDDIANVMAFLASSDSDFMTGQALNVTGGQQIGH